MVSSVLIALLLAAVVAGVPAIAYAQEAGMNKPLSGNSLDVLLEPTLDPEDPHKQTFKVSFLRPGTTTVQVHIDYGFVVKQGDQVIFNAAQQGQPLLHTAEGVVTIPVNFPANGDYTIEVSVAGINFTPMNTETATFDIAVTPEFPAGALGAVAATMATVVVLARYRKRF
jgi:hypothetical protein